MNRNNITRKNKIELLKAVISGKKPIQALDDRQAIQVVMEDETTPEMVKKWKLNGDKLINVGANIQENNKSI